MKTYRVLVCILFAIGVGGSRMAAQVSSSFPTGNALWCTEWSGDGLPSHKSLYGLIGDTTINDLTYSKLYLLSDTILSEENIEYYVGGFRTEGQKVFFQPRFWRNDGGGMYPDILLFDFSAKVGDIVQHNAFTDGEFTYDTSGHPPTFTEIYKVDTINGRIVQNDLFYEGIGSKEGLFGHIMIYIVGPHTMPHLECFKHNDIMVYPNLIEPDKPCNTCPCNGKVNIQEINKVENNSYLYQNQPNPFSKSTEINYFISENVNHASLLIFDIRGTLIRQIAIHHKGDSKTIINANELQAGTYIYTLLIDGKEIDSKKMILTK
jgi:hypothetical protein